MPGTHERRWGFRMWVTGNPQVIEEVPIYVKHVSVVYGYLAEGVF